MFCDASCQAFGACAYVRWKLRNSKFGLRFIAAKSRVAPLKELTIPSLELQGAVLVYRLGKTILEESRLTFERVRYLSDSRVALAWIQGPSRSNKPFVSSLVGENPNCLPCPLLNCEDFSTWRTLIRVNAYVRRLCRNLRSKLNVVCKQKGNVGPLNATEVENAEEYWLKFAQSGLRQKNAERRFQNIYALC